MSPASGRPRADQLWVRWWRDALRRVLRRAGRGYLVGADVEDALAAVARLDAAGTGSVVSYWQGERESPSVVAERLGCLVPRLAGFARTSQLAVKVPGLDLDAALVAAVAELCREAGIRLWFDSHGHDAAAATLAMAAAAAGHATDVGVAIPARWARSNEDLADALAAGHAIRLVKGQLPDPRTATRDVRTCFLNLVDRCVGKARLVSVATHDVALLAESLRRLCRSGTPCEAQLLLGLPLDRPVAVARALGVPVRLYVAYGHPSLVYSPQALWENRRIAWWLAQDVLFPARHRIGGHLAALDTTRRAAGSSWSRWQ